ncbi:hypothetical protein [Loktanella agnita]|uniref:hypothetical protein n=1 Tax=Loktanella agnita TaxID=287097 RepID=UPI0039874706
MSDFKDLHDEVSALPDMPFVQLPTGGTVSYVGLVRLDLPLGATPATPYIGDLALTVAFDAGALPVLGDIRNLQSNSGNALGGVLQVSDGVLHPTAMPDIDYQFDA